MWFWTRAAHAPSRKKPLICGSKYFSNIDCKASRNLNIDKRRCQYGEIVTMSYFRITLLRSGIGLTKRTQGVLKALGLRHRMTTVFYPVTPEVAGQIMKVKELVSVREVDRALSKEELKAERKPDHGFYMEKAMPR